MNKRIHKAFSLAEILVGLLIIGIISSAAMPLMTKMAQEKTGTDRNTIRCINESPANWYNETDGTTELPTEGTMCWAAVTDTQHDRGKSLETAKWYANNGTADQEIMGRKILRTACDLGGEKACDYFINSCWKSGSDLPPYCDDEENFLDLTYYLHQYTDVSPGAIYIKDRLEGLLTKNITNLVNEVNYACFNDQKPDHDQNLGNNIACELLGLNIAWWIEQCNNDNAFACEYCYDKQYNRSCYQIKSVWPEAVTKNYKLTANGDPGSPANEPTIEVNCNMTNLDSAAITGCNVLVPGDCKAGHDNNYNHSCVQIKTEWEEAETGNFYLTYKGAGNPEEVYCNMTSMASAAITGCGYNIDIEGDIPADEYVPGDCEYGRLWNYNRDCDEIFAGWGAAPEGDYYHLTEAGDSPPDLVSSVCPLIEPPPDPENTCANPKGATTTFFDADTGLGYDFMVTNCNIADHDHLSDTNSDPNPGGAEKCWHGVGSFAKYLCNEPGAKRACHALNGANPGQYGEGCADGECTENSMGWRLPTVNEMRIWREDPSSASPLSEKARDLGLCALYSPPECNAYGGCRGSCASNCYPFFYFSRESSDNFRYDRGLLRGPLKDAHCLGSSARCVRRLP